MTVGHEGQGDTPVQRLGILLGDVSSYCVLVIDRLQKVGLDPTNEANAIKKEREILERNGVKDPRGLLEYFRDTRNSLVHTLELARDEAHHFSRIHQYLDTRFLEMALFLSNRDDMDAFLEALVPQHRYLATNQFQIPDADLGKLGALLDRYERVRVYPEDFRILATTPRPDIDADHLLEILVDESAGVCRKLSIEPPGELRTIKLVPTRSTIGAGHGSIIEYNRQMRDDQPTLFTYLLVHEFGHILRGMVVDRLPILDIFKLGQPYAFSTPVSEGIAMHWTERVIERLKVQFQSLGGDLERFHGWYLHYCTARGYAGMRFGEGSWDRQRYLEYIESVCGSRDQSELEYHNMISNLGYKEGYILAYERMLTGDSYFDWLNRGYISLNQ